MFCPRDLPSFSEIRELTEDIIGVEATAIFTAMRTFEIADALASAVESNLRHQFGLSIGRFSLLMILHRHSESELTPSDLARRAAQLVLALAVIRAMECSKRQRSWLPSRWGGV